MASQPGFFVVDERYAALSAAGDLLERLAAVVDFEIFRPVLGAALMFRILVLQALYSLSDEQAEFQLRDRLSFMRFADLGPHQAVPDAKTIWFCREQLKQAGAMEGLFHRFNEVLAAKGLLAKGGQIIGRRSCSQNHAAAGSSRCSCCFLAEPSQHEPPAAVWRAPAPPRRSGRTSAPLLQSSSTRRSLLERETQTVMNSPAARSSSVR